jgi:hypothetical protein
MNEFQKKTCGAYAAGDYAWVPEEETAGNRLSEMLDNCGDGLFKFLMVELSDEEDCKTVETARQRIGTAIHELQELLTVI